MGWVCGRDGRIYRVGWYAGEGLVDRFVRGTVIVSYDSLLECFFKIHVSMLAVIDGAHANAVKRHEILCYEITTSTRASPLPAILQHGHIRVSFS